jgi:hypothetical protein
MDLRLWANLAIASSHFEIESEVLLAFVRAGQNVEFVPIRAIYKTEQSKINPLRDTVRWLRWVVSSPKSKVQGPKSQSEVSGPQSTVRSIEGETSR